MRTIAGLRADCGLSAKDLAEKLDVSKQTVYNWENSQPNLEGKTIVRLCKFFDISADDLLGLNK